MYIPASFLETDIKVLTDLIAQHPLGMIFTAGTSGLMVSPIPFLYRTKDGKPTLVAHLARANSHWKDLLNLKECLVIFHGTENYITPSWYATKKTTHEVVPTWNYEIVEVKGIPKVIDSSDWLYNQVDELTNLFECRRQAPWKITDAPDHFIKTQLMAIIGLEVEITEIKGKWKMSQNRSVEDAHVVVDGLANLNDPHTNTVIAQKVSSRIVKK